MVVPMTELESQILVIVRAAGALKPSQVVEIFSSRKPADVRTACLALASRGDVEVGSDWKMRVVYASTS